MESDEADGDAELLKFWEEMQASQPITNEYIRTDEFEDLCDLVRSSKVLATSLSENERHIRCILAELTNAFGIAMICALRRTDGGGVWRREDEARLHEHNYGVSSPYPKNLKVASPRELWRRVKDTNRMAVWGGTPLSTTERREELVNFLFLLRDEFQHFSPKSWSISRSDTMDAIQELVILIRELIEHPSFSHRLSTVRRVELSENLRLINVITDCVSTTGRTAPS